MTCKLLILSIPRTILLNTLFPHRSAQTFFSTFSSHLLPLHTNKNSTNLFHLRVSQHIQTRSSDIGVYCNVRENDCRREKKKRVNFNYLSSTNTSAITTKYRAVFYHRINHENYIFYFKNSTINKIRIFTVEWTAEGVRGDRTSVNGYFLGCTPQQFGFSHINIGVYPSARLGVQRLTTNPWFLIVPFLMPLMFTHFDSRTFLRFVQRTTTTALPIIIGRRTERTHTIMTKRLHEFYELNFSLLSTICANATTPVWKIPTAQNQLAISNRSTHSPHTHLIRASTIRWRLKNSNEFEIFKMKRSRLKLCGFFNFDNVRRSSGESSIRWKYWWCWWYASALRLRYDDICSVFITHSNSSAVCIKSCTHPNWFHQRAKEWDKISAESKHRERDRDRFKTSFNAIQHLPSLTHSTLEKWFRTLVKGTNTKRTHTLSRNQ